ncbi:phytanoyl-CoA dioxygenase family protein [Chitinophaga barathri]|uniref:Phytanoyl-CoA dioxygenase n=1 Tax=Chitinophaga barathri TaxID=1647451 RepID=A0A3N4MF66_9BACT|nr:phytanoyl-CoA dioxygenase family protein [Chitinophaga barathri]RPD42471.1 phytanoyl-CoA dioxygenase [Chitinophaga barathri]
MKAIEDLAGKGYTVLLEVFSIEAVQQMVDIIRLANRQGAAFRQTADLFAIRRVMAEIPALQQLVLTPALLDWVKTLGGKEHFLVKSIYFDKPGASNWFVAWHQDLTISVDRKHAVPHFGPWTVKQEQFAVQPPVEILENMITFRIHLDDTDENNGALKVIPGSHLKQVHRADTINRDEETICAVPAGSIMVMKPLLMHASGRTTNHRNRRVLHLEFSSMALPEPLQWAEYLPLNN